MPVFQKGNKAACKNPKVVLRKFQEMLRNAKNDENILCYEDACNSIGWRDSKCHYWTKKNPVFEVIKKDIQAAIRRRINKNALIGERAGGFASAAAIWRQKQLGEKDQHYQDHTTKGEKIDNPFLDLMQQSSNDNSASH